MSLKVIERDVFSEFESAELRRPREPQRNELRIALWMRLAYAPNEVGEQKFLDEIPGITNNSPSIIDSDV